MTKQEFLTKLRQQLWALPWEDAQRSVDFYTEMIDERMDEGLSEEAAVAAVGDLDEIVKQILQETPRPPVVTEQGKAKRRAQPWLIVLLILGAPVWVPVVASIASAVLSAYVSLWVAVALLYVGVVAAGATAVGCLIGAGAAVIGGRGPEAVVMLGAGLVSAGVAIVLALVGNLAAKGMAALTNLIVRGVKSLFAGKERKV